MVTNPNDPSGFPKSFVDMLIRGQNTPMARERSKAATKWLRDTVRKMRMSTPEIMKENRARMRSGPPTVGSMYLFQYDPKHKATLPYYDVFPLVFPIEPYQDGFLGINMHYLPPILRARLMNALYSLLNNKKFSPQTRLKISYQILKGASKYRYFKPCLKRYLYAHVQSRYMSIRPIEWDFVLFTPLAQFKKRTIQHVWRESRIQLGL